MSADMSEFSPTHHMETPGQYWSRIKDRKALPLRSVMQAAAVANAIAAGNHTTAKIVGYCDDMPQLGLTRPDKVLSVCKAMAVLGFVVPYIEPLTATLARPWRWQFFLSSQEADDAIPAGLLSLDEANARFDGDDSDPANVVDFGK